MALESGEENGQISKGPEAAKIKDETSRDVLLTTASGIDYFKLLFKDVLGDKIPTYFFNFKDHAGETTKRINAFSAREQLTKLVTKYALYPEGQFLRQLVDLENKIQRIDFQQLDKLIDQGINFSSIEAVTDLVDQKLDAEKIKQYAKFCQEEGYVIKNGKILTKEWDTDLNLIQELIDNHIIKNRSDADYMTTSHLKKLKYMTQNLGLSLYDIQSNFPTRHNQTAWYPNITEDKINNYEKICNTLGLKPDLNSLERINIQNFHIENFEAIKNAGFSIKSMVYTGINNINDRSKEEIQKVIEGMQWLRNICHVTKFGEKSDTSPVFYSSIFEESLIDNTSISERCKNFYKEVGKEIEKEREITDEDVMDYNKAIEYNSPSF